MDLETLLTTRVVIDELKASDDQGAFQEIAEALLRASIIGQKDCVAIRDAFLARERVAATSLGFGMAVPHVFSEKVPSALLIVARSSAGVHMKSPDGRPTRLFFCLIANEASRPAYLRILAAVAKVARDSYWRRCLDKVATATQVYDALIEGEKALGR
jgi:PTS system nitrogen regulatory IIA component